MASLHVVIGHCALALGDVDGAEVAFNIFLEHFRDKPTSYKAYIARLTLARLELCHRNPTSCLALIQTVEIPHLPINSSLFCQLVQADKCLFTQELGQAMEHAILSLMMAKSISD